MQITGRRLVGMTVLIRLYSTVLSFVYIGVYWSVFTYRCVLMSAKIEIGEQRIVQVSIQDSVLDLGQSYTQDNNCKADKSAKWNASAVGL